MSGFQRSKLLKDEVLTAALSGAVATAPFELFTRLLLWFGVGKYSVYELSSLIVTLSRPNLGLGIVIAGVIGGTIAVMIYLLFDKLGTENLVIKCSGVGLLSWVLIEAGYTMLIEGPRLIRARPVGDYYLEMIGSLLYGFLLGILLEKLIFKRPDF